MRNHFAKNCRDVMPSEVRENPVNFIRFVDRPPGDEVGDMGSGVRKCVRFSSPLGPISELAYCTANYDI